jgi:hypothetical protein
MSYARYFGATWLVEGQQSAFEQHEHLLEQGGIEIKEENTQELGAPFLAYCARSGAFDLAIGKVSKTSLFIRHSYVPVGSSSFSSCLGD